MFKTPPPVPLALESPPVEAPFLELLSAYFYWRVPSGRTVHHR
jgi:hypothetical protein